MTDRYGEFVRFNPPLEPKTLLIWGAPFIMLILGAVIIGRIVRQRSRMPLDDEPSDRVNLIHGHLPRHRGIHGCDCSGRRGPAAVRKRQSRLLGAAAALAVAGAAAGLYPLWSNWNWHAPVDSRTASPEVLAMVAKLQKHMEDAPGRSRGLAASGAARTPRSSELTMRSSRTIAPAVSMRPTSRRCSDWERP